MIDTHAHLDFPELSGDIDGVLERFKKSGGTYIVSCSTSVPSSQLAISLSQKYSRILPALGLHPELANPGSDLYADAISHKWIEAQGKALSGLLSDYPQVVAVGECGLDYYHMKRERMTGRETIIENERILFEQCIGLAIEFSLPLIIHCRDEEGDKQAEAECLELIVKKGRSRVRGVFHSYTGSLDYLDDILALGFYVSFNGIITYRNNENVRKILNRVPLEKLLIETDCPFLTPNRRKTAGVNVCEPAFVDEVAEVVARVKGVSEEQLWDVVENNAEKLFRLSKHVGHHVGHEKN